MISLNNIDAGYLDKQGGRIKVLKNINLSVPSGEFITVVGGNGAGKSTFMNLLAGELIPFSGSFVLDNLDVTTIEAKKRSKYVGRVFQDPRAGSFPDMTIEENLSIAYQRGKNSKLQFGLSYPKRKLFREALASLGIGLEDKLNVLMGSLSGGQRQGVCLLMACLCNCKMLLLDEHTAALDPKMAAKILKLSNEFVRRQKVTTFMITHSLNQALEYGDRTIVLNSGEIVADLKGKQRNEANTNELLRYFAC